MPMKEKIKTIKMKMNATETAMETEKATMKKKKTMSMMMTMVKEIVKKMTISEEDGVLSWEPALHKTKLRRILSKEIKEEEERKKERNTHVHTRSQNDNSVTYIHTYI